MKRIEHKLHFLLTDSLFMLRLEFVSEISAKFFQIRALHPVCAGTLVIVVPVFPVVKPAAGCTGTLRGSSQRDCICAGILIKKFLMFKSSNLQHVSAPFSAHP